MDETGVLTHLVDHLDNKGWDFYIDTHGSDEIATLAEEYHHCNLHRTITIGTRIPDVIGYTREGEIFAIEVKGDEGIRKGIGQAAFYRSGVHQSYLAGAGPKMNEFEDTALSSGIGIYKIKDNGEIQSTEPPKNIAGSELDKTRRALAVKTASFEADNNTFPSMTRPENSLLPVVALGNRGGAKHELPFQKYGQLIEESPQGYNQPNEPLRLANTLQLVNWSSDKIHLTEVGLVAFRILQGSVVEKDQPEQAMYKFIEAPKSNHNLLYNDYPTIAAFLRNRYLAVPDIRLLTHVLSSHEGTRGEMSLMLAKIALTSPDAYLNLFCSRGADSEFRKLIENSNYSPDDKEFRSEVLQITSPNALYNFLYQIRHIKILTENSTPVHQSADVEIDEYYWEWDSTIVGDFGRDI